jgi:hypothetical protein
MMLLLPGEFGQVDFAAGAARPILIGEADALGAMAKVAMMKIQTHKSPLVEMAAVTVWG